MTIGKIRREEVANREIGHTRVGRSLAVFITLSFVAAIAAVPLIQAWIDGGLRLPAVRIADTLQHPAPGSAGEGTPAATGSRGARRNWVVERNERFLAALDVFEDRLEEESFLRDLMLAPGQYFLLSVLGQGNENVIPGRHPWLYYQPDVLHLVQRGFLDPDQQHRRRMAPEPWEPEVEPDSVGAILDFHRQLKQRGVALWLLPTPVKPAVEPGPLADPGTEPPLHNRSWPAFLRQMEDAGIVVFDPASLLARAGQRSAPVDAYLKTDTHWRPESMEIVATTLAGMLRQRLPLSPEGRAYRERAETVRNRGDLQRMLELPEQTGRFDEESVTIRRVLTPAGEFWQPGEDAEVLLLGDSFTNIYSLHGMGWGDGAGLAERLAFALNAPVDRIARNDDGAHATRRLLAASLARGKDRLKGKKVVIWQFAYRELSHGHWPRIPLQLAQSPEAGFFVPGPGETRRVTGLVADISRTPSPGSVPYRDSIATLHLVDVRGETGGGRLGQALVYGWALRNDERTPLSFVREGDRVSLVLQNWEDVQGDYGSYRRSSLEKLELELQRPAWGEVVHD